jgi:hypothetical protein
MLSQNACQRLRVSLGAGEIVDFNNPSRISYNSLFSRGFSCEMTFEFSLF